MNDSAKPDSAKGARASECHKYNKGEQGMIRTHIDKSQRWLTIKLRLQTPKASQNGNLVIASSRGVRSDDATFEGKRVYAVANAP